MDSRPVLLYNPQMSQYDGTVDSNGPDETATHQTTHDDTNGLTHLEFQPVTQFDITHDDTNELGDVEMPSVERFVITHDYTNDLRDVERPPVNRFVITPDKSKRSFAKRIISQSRFKKPTAKCQDVPLIAKILFLLLAFFISTTSIILQSQIPEAAEQRGKEEVEVEACPTGLFVAADHAGCICSTTNTLRVHPASKLCTDKDLTVACKELDATSELVGGECKPQGTDIKPKPKPEPEPDHKADVAAEKKSKTGVIVGVVVAVVVVCGVLAIVVVVRARRSSTGTSGEPFMVASGVYGNTYGNDGKGEVENLQDTMNYNFDKEA